MNKITSAHPNIKRSTEDFNEYHFVYKRLHINIQVLDD